jgi:hypothetical protein
MRNGDGVIQQKMQNLFAFLINTVINKNIVLIPQAVWLILAVALYNS